jgi:hypothetical protein
MSAPAMAGTVEVIDRNNAYEGITREYVYSKGDDSYTNGIFSVKKYWDQANNLRKVEQFFTDAYTVKDGRYFVTIFYDNKGMKLRQENHYSKWLADKYGDYKSTAYYLNDKIVRAEYFATKDKAHDEGSIKRVLYYNIKGNNAKTEYYHTEPYALRVGDYKTEVHYDSDGYKKMMIRYHTDEYAAYHRYQTTVYYVDRSGDTQRIVYYDKNGEVVAQR